MITDPEEFFEELAKSCPELMEKSNIGDCIGVDAGWFTIIKVLCNQIYKPVQVIKYQQAAAINYPRDDGGKYLDECDKKLSIEIENLPIISDIKEKFGTLRFYCDNADERVSSLIDFAESMSSFTCEVCGDAGKQDNAGWIKTHCQKHRKSHDEDQPEIQNGTVSPKFQDDEI